MADNYYYSVRLLMDMEGVNNGTVFTDYSLAHAAWTAVGNAKTSNTAAKFGNTSLSLDGASWLESEARGLALMGKQDFTLEMWVKTAKTDSVIVDLYAPYKGWTIQVVSGRAAVYDGIAETRAILSNALINDNVWHHIALCRQGTTLRCFIDGVLDNSAFNSSDFNSTPAKIGIGAFVNRNLPAYNLIGYIDEVRFTFGVARYTANFTPPGALDMGSLTISSSVASVPVVVVQTRYDALTYQSIMASIKLRDVIFGGAGRIAGTTKIKGTPNVAVRRRVRLLRERDGMMIRETWSDPVTGAYSFDNIDENYQYTVISFDHDHNHRAVIADNLTPELMP